MSVNPRKLGEVLIGLALLLPWCARSQDLEYLGGQGKAESMAPYFAGGKDYLLVSSGGNLVILDVGDRMRPTPVGMLLKSRGNGGTTIRRLAAQGTLAYLGTSEGLEIVDLADVRKPVRIGAYKLIPSWPVQIYATALAVKGGYAYLGTPSDGLRIVDVSDPAKPVDVPFKSGVARSNYMALYGDSLYSVSSEGLAIYDLADPAKPELKWIHKPAFVNTSGVAVSGRKIYLSHRYDGFTILDMSLPPGPKLVGSGKTMGSAEGITLSGSHAYLGCNSAGLNVFDVSNPANPTLLDRYGASGAVTELILQGGTGFLLSEEFGVDLADFTRPGAPAALGSYQSTLTAEAVVVAGDFAYLRTGSAVHIVDVARPGLPRVVSTVKVGRGCDAAFLEDSRLYVFGPGESPGGSLLNRLFQVFDVTEPALPEFRSEFKSGRYSSLLGLVGGRAYLADDTLHILDVTDASAPKEVARVKLPGFAATMAVSGPLAVFNHRHNYSDTEAYTGLTLWNVSDPLAPRQVGKLDIRGGLFPLSLAFSGEGGVLHVGDADRGIASYDVTDPKDVRLLSDLREGHPRNILVQGKLLLVTQQDFTVRFYDYNDPRNPKEIRRFAPDESIIDIAARNDILFTAAGGGLQVFRLPAGTTGLAYPPSPGKRLGRCGRLPGKASPAFAPEFSQESRDLRGRRFPH